MQKSVSSSVLGNRLDWCHPLVAEQAQVGEAHQIATHSHDAAQLIYTTSTVFVESGRRHLMSKTRPARLLE